MNGTDGFVYTVEEGDSLSKVAKRFGVPSWKDIFYHDKNAAFRRSHPNANLIYPGDQVWVPGAKPNLVVVPSGRAAPVIHRTPVPVKIRASDGASAPARFMPVKGRMQLKAVPDSGKKGTYRWSTSSANIRLTDDNTQTVTVTGGDRASLSVGAEEIKLVFTPTGGVSYRAISMRITVVKVVFSRSAGQSYGYDDMDSVAGVLSHISVKKNETTEVRVLVTGRITGADLHFTSDDPTIADSTLPANPGAAFDLAINGKAKNKSATIVHARVNGSAGDICASLTVNVYKEKAVTATVAKIYDSASAGTTLSRPNFDVETAETEITKWYKLAVGTIDLTDHSATGGAIDVRFDLNGNGKLDLEPGATSSEERAIRNAFNPAGQKIVVVKDLTWIYYLKNAASANDSTIALKDSYSAYMKYIVDGESYDLGTGASQETITVDSKSGTTVNLRSPLTKNHATSDGIMWPLSGLSGNPIFVAEQGKTEAKERQTMGHECGHSLMLWLDLNSADNLMHHSIGRTDTRVRFKDLPKKYEAGNENQWEKISR